MAILKIRDANGNIKSIAIMKGDKGDGMPDGGSAGQVVKKTADGTEWADIASSPAVVMSNTDTTVTSVAITQRGLYEVYVSYAFNSNGEYTQHKHLVSIDDLSKAESWESTIGVHHRASTDLQNYDAFQYLSTLEYNNGELSSQIRTKRLYIASNKLFPSVLESNSPHFIAEVKLLIPYA